ncbi:DNA-processing protein DprA [Marinimicrobium sp. C6131]|uniref:DNA-processing protein DprA n=1 Tax=Marinimicrobium sp. C6131 TaxID=3022676 RepID=UPI00223E6367|nr:DNA-processing protein DprA [Marinimicrobium sp. C6131]UZJ43783.1 DNA-processing protein DprA [Marinimicrobium sp. C6131]
MEEHHFSHLLLQRLPGAGAAKRARLLEHFGSAGAVIEASRDALKGWLDPEACAALGDYQRNPKGCALAQSARKDLDWLAEHPEVQVLSLEDEDYPPLLREIRRAPPLLFVRGSVTALSMPQIAMVGSRNPSTGGRDNARQFAAFLAGRGFAITSGLAMGVDGFAHAGALDVEGVTIGVIGTGIDRVYPARHRQLAEDIVANGGAVVSEFPLRASPQPSNFPQRNRIISGLSGGTLVVEAALKSGSLITARYALQQNREVFAIPGSIHNPLARGCHRLIREGATLVETARDIVEQLGGYLGYQSDLFSASSEASLELTDKEQRVLEALGHDPRDLDSLADDSDIEVGELSALLIGLQLKGAITETAAGFERTALANLCD